MAAPIHVAFDARWRNTAHAMTGIHSGALNVSNIALVSGISVIATKSAMAALTTRLVEQHGIDPRRIHLRGYSGGARLASHLTVAMADRLSSACCVGGIRFVPSSGALPPLLAIHGGLDTFNPYDGGSGPRWSESVESVVYQWAVASGCGPTPHYLTLSDDVRETRYIDTGAFAAVRLITVTKAAHSWPGTSHADHIAQFGTPGSLSASQAHWDFIRDVDQLRQLRTSNA
jgi:polyhydroxybutyrate depolymerase